MSGTTAKRLAALRSHLPVELVETDALVAEVVATIIEASQKLCRVSRLIDAIHTIGNEAGWEDNEVADLIESLPIRTADRAFDLLADEVSQSALHCDLMRFVRESAR